MSIYTILFLPIIVFEIFGSYGIGAYARSHDLKWLVLTFVSFGLTGVLLCYLASRGNALSWLSLLVFGCITPLAGYFVGLYFFGEKFSLQTSVALCFILVAITVLAFPKS